MPFATRDGVRLYWKLEGAADKPPLVLLNSIGTDMALWDACVPHLLPAFRLLRIDAHGHGASDAPPGDYSLAMLADDVAAVMDAAGFAQAAIAGVSLGGMIAMAFALGHPTRASALALICTSAAMDRSAWESRIATVRAEGTGAIAEMAVGRSCRRASRKRIPRSPRRCARASPRNPTTAMPVPARRFATWILQAGSAPSPCRRSS